MSEAVEATPGSGVRHERRVALALGSGGAGGPAHIGLLEVLEEEGIRPTYLAGTSIGGPPDALWAGAIPAREVVAIARGFRLPGRLVSGRLLVWEDIFPSAAPMLDRRTFEDLATCLAVSAVDLARSREPDVVIVATIGVSPRQSLHVESRYVRVATARGGIAPNPITACPTYKIAMRAVEIALDRRRALAIAMTGPEVLIDIDLRGVSIGDFHSLDDVIESGRRATRVAQPQLCAALAAPPRSTVRSGNGFTLHVDPVCRMAISSGRARTTRARRGHVLLLFRELSQQFRASPGSLRRRAICVRFPHIGPRSAE